MNVVFLCSSSWHDMGRLFTSSLWLESNPTSLCRPCFSVTPSRRSKAGSSLNARPMFTGLGPVEVSSPSSAPSLPRLIRFSDRSLLRTEHGRPGKRALATVWALNPAEVLGDGNPPPDAAIIYYKNTDSAEADGDWDTRGKMDCSEAKARDRKERQVHHGKTNFSVTRELFFFFFSLYGCKHCWSRCIPPPTVLY